ncbi:MAG: M48 family metallopeptidase [Pseudomonadota bacterium]
MTPPIRVVRHARARGYRLSVDPRDGSVRLTIPARAVERTALQWAERQRAWIDAQSAAVPPRTPFTPDAVIPVEGEMRRIAWRADTLRAPRLDEDRLTCGGPRDGLELRIERWLKRHALAVLRDETMACAARAGVTVPRVGIGDPRSRWGSCASSGIIRYSWRLILAPAFVRRATVAHEVAHRVHMNHGPEFHALAKKLLGEDPAPAHAWLRSHGASLHRYGG